MAAVLRGDRVRLAVAIAGTIAAVFLVLLHIAFLRAIEYKVTQIYALFSGDVVLVSNRFQFLYRMGDFPVARLQQARMQTGVVATSAVRIASTYWVSEPGRSVNSLLLIGIDPESEFVRDNELRPLLTAIRKSRRIIFDRLSDPALGPIQTEMRGLIRGHTAMVAALYSLGLPMYAASTAVVSSSDFAMYSGEDVHRAQLGLINVAANVSPLRVATELNDVLPDDVRALTREQLLNKEKSYFLDIKPLGIMLRSGLIIGMIVGAVALFFGLSTQMKAQYRAFAVLRAMGFESRFAHLAGALQLLLLTSVSIAFAWFLAMPLFGAVERLSYLSLPGDLTLFTAMLAASIPMIAVAAIPLMRANQSDPAELF